VTVQLVDISNPTSPAIVLDELHVSSTGRPAPFEFEISYNPATIKPGGAYALVVSVMGDGKLMYRSGNKLSMGMQGNRQPVKVTLSPVGSLTTFDEAFVDGRLARYSN
jgi:putative lipoprotein